MKILRIAGDIYPDSMGGIAMHTHLMSKEQARQGHKVKVLTSDHNNDSLPKHEYKDGYEITRLNELLSPLDNPINLGVIPSILQEHNEFDIVHAHSHLFFTTNICAILRKIFDFKLVVTNHGLVSQTAPDYISNLHTPTIGKFTFNSADLVLTYTPEEKRELNKIGIKSPVRVISNGIDCEMYSPTINQSEGKRVLFVGRLKGGKRPELIVKCMKSLTPEYEDIELDIVGDGPLRDQLEELATDLGISESVNFHGYIPNEEMPKFYENANVFVLPSKSEGLPRTVLESMACETPVVVSDLPQLRDVVDGAGYLVNEPHAEDYVAKINHLLESPELRKSMGNNGRSQVEAKFSWESTVKETTNAFYDLIND